MKQSWLARLGFKALDLRLARLEEQVAAQVTANSDALGELRATVARLDEQLLWQAEENRKVALGLMEQMAHTRAALGVTSKPKSDQQ